LIDTLHLCSLIRRHGFFAAQYAQGAAHEGKHFILAGENVQGRQSVYALLDGEARAILLCAVSCTLYFFSISLIISNIESPLFFS
jgi:hypothetical protein